jgi:CDP-diacylglycerol pyrophosphatase
MLNRIVIIAALAFLAVPAARAQHLGVLKHVVSGAEAAHPNALWHIIHGLCLRDMRVSGDPAPCVRVDLKDGYVVIKDVEHPTQYLLVPSERVSGIESPALLAPKSPNYWLAAWTQRSLLEKQLGRPIPREDIGLAINSVTGRTQNQLHIHIDCVRPEVQQALAAQAPRLGARWTSVRLGAGHRRYRARWMKDADLATTDPFKLLARTDPLARADMGRESLALIPMVRPDGQPGFVLLSDRTDDAHDAAAEALLDHRCHILAAADH